MSMIEGTEWCPFCEDETDFVVDEETWIVKCQRCGRPLLLCDKCTTLNGSYRPCDFCKHEDEIHKAMREWEESMVGKIVYWHDPDDEICSDWCKVVRFEDDIYVLRHLKDEEGEFDAYDYEVDIPSEEEVKKVLEDLKGENS